MEQVAAPAGSVIIVNEALIHGTLPWSPADRMRRSIFKYSPRLMSWRSPHGECSFAAPTPEEEAIYQGPGARTARRWGRASGHRVPYIRLSAGRSLMTQLLDRAISEIRKLSIDEQDAIAAVLMAELESERRWERALDAQQSSCPALQTRPP